MEGVGKKIDSMGVRGWGRGNGRLAEEGKRRSARVELGKHAEL
jgi:hypothetical protein